MPESDSSPAAALPANTPLPRASRRVVARRWAWLTGGLLALGLLPFLGLAFSNVPFWDDFGMAMLVREHGLWGAQRVFYHTWGGRYGTAFLQTVGNPLTYGWVGGFYCTPLVFLGGTGLALYGNLREFSRQRLAPGPAAQAAALLLLLALGGLPSIYPMFYWFTAATGYEAGIILMLLAALGGLRALRASSAAARRGWYALAQVSVVITVGLNEIALLLLGWLLLVALAASWHAGRRRAARAWGGLLVSAATGGAVALLAPGNRVRLYGTHHAAQPLPPLDVMGAVRVATDYYTTFLTQPTQVLVLLLAAALLGPRLLRARHGRPAGFRLPLAAGVGVLLVGGGLGFLFYALVNKNPPPARTQSFIWLWLLLGWVAVLWAAGPAQVPAAVRRALEQLQRAGAVLAFCWLAVSLERPAWTEWLRNGPTWRAQHEARFAQLRAAARAGQATTTLAPISGLVPRRVAIMGETLFYNPVSNNSVQRSNNDLTARWFGLDSLRLTARPAYEVGRGL